jgi:cellulose synthase/poly-beta-1,6-N-acetylglucosamine synthase-like glycosyltransferase
MTLAQSIGDLAELRAVAFALIGLCLLLNGVALWQLVLAAGALRRIDRVSEASMLWRHDEEALPPITLIAPAFNEAATIVESVRSLLAVEYPSFEIVVVNDGSRDATLQLLIEAFELAPISRSYELSAPCQPIRGLYGAPHQSRLIVVDKLNGGKADALNAGVNLARTPIICSMDADSLLERDALLRAVAPFVEHPRETVAVGGTIRVANGCEIEFGQVKRVGVPKNVWALIQSVEYLRAFLMARVAWSRIQALTIISGAFGLFARKAVLEVGGYSHGTVGEDMELVVKLHKHNRRLGRRYRICFVPEAVCWTEAPESLGVLGRQRSRWQRGSIETLMRHGDMLFDRRCGLPGLLGLGHVLVYDVLQPIVELLGLVLVPALCVAGLLPPIYVVAQLAVSSGLGLVTSVGSLALEETELRRFPDARCLLALMGASLIESFGYRQLNSFWRLRGLWQFATGAKAWGHMPRKGFAKARVEGL